MLLVIFSLFFSACGTSPIQYEATLMEVDKAREIVEELTWAQHPTWRPSAFEINDKYIAWNFGTRSDSNAIAVGGSGVVGASGSTISKNLGERAYFRSIEKVELLLWKRKFRTWYTVSLTGKNNSHQYALRTRNLEDAKLFTDAMYTVVTFYKEKDKNP